MKKKYADTRINLLSFPKVLNQFCLSLMVLFFVSFANAATITSTAAGGNWNATTTWVDGVVPLATDDVVIANGSTVTLDVDISVNSLSISGTLKLKTLSIINTQLVVVTSGGTIYFDKSVLKLPLNASLYLQNGQNSLTGSCNNNDEIKVGDKLYAVCKGTGNSEADLFYTIEVAGGINVVTAGVIGTSQTICNGGIPATLTSTTAGTGPGTNTYEWQTNASGSYVTIPSATSETYSPPALTSTTSYQRRTVSVAGEHFFYSGYTTPVTITVVAKPTTANAGADQILCNAPSYGFILNGNQPTVGTGAWSTPDGSVAFYNVTAYNSAADVAPGVTGRAVWTITNGPCASSDEVIIQRGSATVPTATSPQTFCSGATVASLVATGTALKWYAASTGGTALPGTDVLTTKNYYVSQNSGSCESARTLVAVTVNASPTISAPNVGSVCSGNTYSSGTITLTGTTFDWVRAGVANVNGAAAGAGGTGIAKATGFSETLTNSTSSAINVIYVLTPKSASGCSGTPFNLVVTVTPKPTKVSTPVTICSGATYTWLVNGTAYTTAGTYLVSNDGCTADQELVLTVTPKPAKVSTPVTICSGATYTWLVNGTAYTTAGTYLVSNDGCTADQELVLTVTPKPTKVSTPVTICSGATYTWLVNGTAYTAAGTYLVSNDGCTADQELVLTVTPKPAKVSTPVTICSGATYTWLVNGTAYTAAGTYLVSNDGCTADQELVLTVTPKPAKVSTPVTICSGATYTWLVNGTAYTAAGTYLVSNDGCTADQELVLTVTPKPTKVSTPVTICSGATYTWLVNGTAYTTAGTYLVSNDGCTADQELVLTVTPKPTKVSTPVTICSGATYTWLVNGTAYTAAGTYLVSNDGCTADQELVLTVTPKPTKVSTPVTICSGATYTWLVNGTAYTAAGTYLVSNDGCTADQELVLTVTPKPAKVSTPVTICSGATYTWLVNGTAYTTAGTYLVSNDGCTADQELVLTVTPKPAKVSTPVTICSGATYTWLVNGTAYTTAGTYLVSNDGCTADQELVLTVTPKPTKVSTPVTICSGATYTWLVNGTAYTAAGTYLVSNDGCTADQELVLTVTPKPAKVSTPVTICSGATYTWLVNGTAYTAAGTYLVSNDGCTADQELVLTVTPKPAKVSTPVTICSGATYTWLVNGTAYTAAGTYLVSNDGCTADQELVLTVTPKPTKVSTPVTICSGATYTWLVNGTAYTTAGTYLVSNDGCTADQELVLTVTPKPTKVSTPVTICSGATYTWLVNGTAYTAAGTYLVSNDGCTADQELVLTVTPKPTKVSTPVTICSGATYTWLVNGTAYTAAGTYLVSNDGCTADQELVLTVTPKPAKVSTPVTICSGATYTWLVNGTAYTTAGTYLVSNDGCTADQELVLTVTPKPTKVSTPVTICSGATYTWLVNGTAYTAAGTYLVSNDGCTADQELVLTVTPKPAKVSTPVTICSGATYTWLVNGTAYTAAGTYLVSNDGCTADQELVLTVTPKPTKVSTPVTICSGATYTWLVNGTAYTAAGTYLVSNDGCTADQELVLTVTPKPTKVSTPVTICSGATYTWLVNGTAYTAAGTYLVSNDGCTADQELVLTVTPKPTKVSTPVTICSGATYTWLVNGTAYTTAGTYLVSNDGCTADQELVLTVTPKPTKVSTPVTICSGATYTWLVNGTAYTAAGTYLVSNDGCTADQELVLTVTPKPTKVSTPVTICSGATYTWLVNGTAYTAAGTYLVSNDGCTADQELVLTVTPKPAKVSTPVTICSGATYTWLVNGTAYTAAGTYLVSNDGCTADQELVLTVTPKPTKVSTPVTICSGATYTWLVNGTAYTTAGTYLVSNDGCTADQELVLTVTPKPAKVSTPVTICSGATYTWLVNGTAYTAAGTYLVSNDGCTADQELVLTVTPKPTKVSTPVTICSGATYTWLVNGTAYTTAGTYLVSNDGCTADQELVLTVTPKPTKVSTPVTICSGATYTWLVNGTAYTAAGTYLVSNDGCTADQELVLTVTPKPAKVSTPVTICSGATYTWLVNGTAYTTAGTYLVSNDGCTADQELVLTVTPKPAKVSIPVTICSGATYTWLVNGTAYTAAGTYLVSNDGCTADQELVLTVTPKPTKVSTPVTICSGATYTWLVNGTAYTAAGTYLVSNDGCTADQELVLTVTPKPTKVSTPVTICSGATYTWLVNGTAYTTAGTYLVSNDGCTADQELVLTVTPKPAKVSTPVTICSGATYTWLVNGTAYTTAGTYLVSNDGCTADQELVLTVTPKPTKVSTPVTICSGATYTWLVNGTAYTAAGTYLVSNDGCTADQELVLTVTPKPAKVSTPVTICSGATYTWLVNGTAYTAAGTYLVSNDGCTADQELVLTVTPKPAKVSTPVTICSGATYTWLVNGTAYTAAGTYLVSNDGCTADQELVLTVTPKPTKVSTPVTICSGATYTWLVNGTAYTTAGTYLVSNDGCTADQELVLTVTPKPTKVSTPVTICSGATYTWLVNGTAYTAAGTYLVSNDGCTADQELVLTVTPKPTKVSTPVTICSGATYTWLVNGTAYTAAGTYLVSNDGCTADQELVLTVTPKPAKVSTPVTICSGATYTWLVNGTAYTAAGTYLVSNDGCTADQELVLTVTPKPAKVSTPVTICSGATYTWLVNGTAYTAAGTYLVSNDGCTADQELVLTVTPKPTKVSTPVTICSGATYTWLVNGTAYTTAGTYLVSNDGCTADQELVLTVTPKPTKVSTPVTICSGATYTWLVNGTAYTTAGTYLVSNDGCTADQELVLTVTPKPAKVSTPVTICSGATYTWLVNGTAYTTAGTYLVSNDGCTADQELVLTVTPKPTKVSTPVTICSGATYTWLVNGTAYTAAGTYLVSNDGCTADQELVLTVTPKPTKVSTPVTICSGATYTWLVNGTAYTAAGTYLVSNDGCTADQELVLTVTPKPAKVSTPVTICSGATYTWLVNGTAYTAAGTYLVSNDGCTADQELVLTVTPKPTKVSTPVTICSGATYTWLVNGTAYTTAGTYLVSNDGCTADQELVLTVTPKPAKVSTPVTICSGATYTWLVNGTAYTAAGTYLVSNDGCTADQELVLTVTPKPTKVSTPVTICSGATYTWLVNGTAYTAAGTYLVSNDGCTADQELVLTVTPKPAKVSTPVTICSGATYTWLVNGTAYTTAGTYLVSNDGCTADQELVLTVTPKPTKVSTPVTICSGATYTWLVNGTAYTAAGTYLVSNDGCTADQELVLTVTPKPTKVSTPVTICSGATYTWLVNGTAYTAAGTYLVSNDGCTADQELVLTVTPKPAKVSTPVTICSGATYTWLVNGTAYTAAGTYLVSNDGCTADQELVLTVTPKPAKVSTPVTICSGATYTWLVNGTAYTAAGTYLVSNDGCTADQELVLTVTPKPTKVSTPVTICSGATYTWLVNGTAYTAAGTYLVSNDGCTADQELVLTVTPKPTKVSTPVTICSGATYTWLVNGTAYTAAGTYLVSNDGCTADQELVLTVTPKPTKVSTPVTICSGATYTWLVNGTAYTAAGTYLVSNDGCTADQELVLTVTPKPAKVSTPVTICSGATYTWLVNGTAYTTAGTYLVSNDGCTADQELVLTVTPKPTKVSTPVTICSGATYTWLVNGTAYTAAGTYLVSNDGCTADQELVLTVTPKPTKVSTPVTICSGATYTWLVNGTAYTAAGTYLVSNDGCTADQELVLTVTPKPTKVSTPVTICSGATYTWLVNGTAYTAAGTYLVSNDGCTADQELVLTVTPKPAKVSTPVTICSGATYTWLVNGTAYTTAGTYLVSNDGCTADQELVLTVTPKPAKVSTPVTICSGATYTWLVNGTAYTTAGTYLVSNDGCTADQELVLTVTPKPTKVSTPVTICSGATYTWLVNGTAYTAAGTYLVSNDGCTADQELVLTVTPKPAKVSTPVTICSGATYTWLVNGTAYTAAGTYLVSNDGCTADQELVLTVTPKPAKVSTPVTICSGATYTWLVNGTAYTAAGTYLVSNDGCTADQELVLTVTPKPTKVSTPVTICSGATYTWLVNGTAYTTAGTYLVSNDGCTADQELVLTVTPKPTKVSTPVTICSGATYTWLVNGTAYTAAGTYLVSNDGCTADQELVLTVTPKPTKVSTPVTICSGATYTWLVNGTAYTAAGTYLVSNDGCTADQELVLTVTPKPTKVSTPVTICSGATYTWLVNGTAYTTAGTYLVSNDGCTADQELVLTVTPKPVAGVNGSLAVAAGAIPSDSQLFAQLGGTPDGGGIWTNVGNIYTYTVKATSPCTVDATATITVTAVNTPPTMNDFTNPALIKNNTAQAILPLIVTDAEGGPLTYVIKSLPDPASGVLTLNGLPLIIGQELTQAQAALLQFTPKSTYAGNKASFKVTAKGNGGLESAVATITIPLVEAESPSIALKKSAVLNDENGDASTQVGETITYTLVVTNAGNVALTNVIVKDAMLGFDTTAASIVLAVGEKKEYELTYAITQADIDRVEVVNKATATGNSPKGFLVSAEDIVNTGLKLVLPENVVKVYNAVSPNGDGLNDIFRIEGLQSYPVNTVEIYNRWGVLVFERENYNNDDRAFKGISEGRVTVKQSEELPTGTYFYILKYMDNGSNTVSQSGYLYINR
ncbi:gliding motility-associated C-terminal domain-containing protein [Flavobacterium sp. W1B]|uniref:T9SS type B sorting domain-containing protein n=1 Tax=Flavobacterium sp. W1B TaxID=3394146 RepID=UPI0039BD393F